MADSYNESGGAFSRAFLPGLVLGLVIGGLAGAVLPDWIGGRRIPAAGQRIATPGGGEGDRERDERGSEMVEENTEEPAGEDAQPEGGEHPQDGDHPQGSEHPEGGDHPQPDADHDETGGG